MGSPEDAPTAQKNLLPTSPDGTFSTAECLGSEGFPAQLFWGD